MNKKQILKRIKDEMQSDNGGVFAFIDWLQQFIDEQLEK